MKIYLALLSQNSTINEDLEGPTELFPGGKEIQQKLFKTNMYMQLQVWKSPCYSLKTSGRAYRKKKKIPEHFHHYFAYFYLYIF